MKLKYLAVIVATTIIGTAGLAGAAEPVAPQPGTLISGTVLSVNPDQRTMTVKSGFRKKQVLLDENARVFNGARWMRVHNLRPGDRVKISATQENGTLVGRSMILDRDTLIAH